MRSFLHLAVLPLVLAGCPLEHAAWQDPITDQDGATGETFFFDAKSPRPDLPASEIASEGDGGEVRIDSSEEPPPIAATPDAATDGSVILVDAPETADRPDAAGEVGAPAIDAMSKDAPGALDALRSRARDLGRLRR